MRPIIVLFLAFKYFSYTTYRVRCLICITSLNPYGSAIVLEYYHSHFTNEQAEALAVSATYLKACR